MMIIKFYLSGTFNENKANLRAIDAWDRSIIQSLSFLVWHENKKFT